MTQSITIQLSDKVYQQLQRTAELSRQPVEKIIANSLAYSLPPLLEDIPAKYQADVYPLLEMNDKELRQEATAVFPPDAWSHYERLLAKQKEAPPSPTEQKQFDDLHQQADLLTLRKGYAVLLLKRRGYQVSLSELPSPS